MSDKAWKAFERRVAAHFSTERTALSGGNGKVTRSDTHHPALFVECKHNQESALWTLYLKTREMAAAEDKTPVLCLGKRNHPGYLVVLHSDTLVQALSVFLDDFLGGLSLDQPTPASPSGKRRKKKAV